MWTVRATTGEVVAKVGPRPLCGGRLAVCTSEFSSLLLQKGPPSGKDRVKKGGSYMCHKVSQVMELYFGVQTAGLWIR